MKAHTANANFRRHRGFLLIQEVFEGSLASLKFPGS